MSERSNRLNKVQRALATALVDPDCPMPQISCRKDLTDYLLPLGLAMKDVRKLHDGRDFQQAFLWRRASVPCVSPGQSDVRAVTIGGPVRDDIDFASVVGARNAIPGLSDFIFFHTSQVITTSPFTCSARSSTPAPPPMTSSISRNVYSSSQLSSIMSSILR